MVKFSRTSRRFRKATCSVLAVQPLIRFFRCEAQNKRPDRDAPSLTAGSSGLCLARVLGRALRGEPSNIMLDRTEADYVIYILESTPAALPGRLMVRIK